MSESPRARWMPIIGLALFLAVPAPPGAPAATRDYAVEVSAVVQESPPRIDFSWRLDPSAEHYFVFKKALVDTVWEGPLAVLDGGATQFSDQDVAVGEAYEYSFRKTLGEFADTVLVAGGTPVTFGIYDSWGDGICCHHGLGSYRVASADSVYAAGGEFGDEELTSFVAGTAGGPGVELVVSLELDVFGQETSWDLTHDSTGQTLAAGGPYQTPRFGHIGAAIRYPAVEDRGAILLLVTAEMAVTVHEEIERLELDLIADGYRVVLRYVAHDATVPEVKELVVAACLADPTIETLFILGHVPVPYSGDIRGAHSDHQGAWPADLYYGELDGEWTDSIVFNTSAIRPANHNVPGDGKFDQTFLPSLVDLQVGRVDLSLMPAFFPQTEGALLRRYLDKNHAYRRGEFLPERRGLIDDNVGEAWGLAFAAVGWRNFTAMYGQGNATELPYMLTLEQESYQWAYGCGGGSYNSCNGIGTTNDFAHHTLYTVFTPLYGSYFGDWDNPDNLLRAPLAAAGQPLVCFWAGRPTWHLHHMEIGYPIGYSTRVSQNNDRLYTVSDGSRQIHTALMGDPTLILHVVRPVEAMSAELQPGGEAVISWSPPDDEVEGYRIYRAPAIREPFARLSGAVVTDTSFVDPEPLPGRNVYMVRALALETTGGGSYENLSGGVFDSLITATAVGEAAPTPPGQLMVCFPNPFNPTTTIRYHLQADADVELRVFSVSGRLVRTLVGTREHAGWHAATWDARDDRGHEVASGVYVCELRANEFVTSRRLTLLK
jgi:hypothetical protein